MSRVALVRPLAVLTLTATALLGTAVFSSSPAVAQPICEQPYVDVLQTVHYAPAATCVPYNDATLCDTESSSLGTTYAVHNLLCVPRP